MNLMKILIKILGFVLAIPFITYGFLGIIESLKLRGIIDDYLGIIGNYNNPVTAIILVVIGCCLLYGLNAFSNKLR